MNSSERCLSCRHARGEHEDGRGRCDYQSEAAEMMWLQGHPPSLRCTCRHFVPECHNCKGMARQIDGSPCDACEGTGRDMYGGW
jgi:hypothetical protein